jgi:tetratricopeptide (TPR) repeat protein
MRLCLYAVSIVTLICFCTACSSSTSLARKGEFFDQHYFAEEAGEKFRRALRADNKNPRALADLALWYLRHGEPGLAEMLLARACLQGHIRASAHEWALYARVLYRNEKTNEAQLALERSLARFPNDQGLLTAKKELERETTIRRLRQDLQRRPNDAALRTSLINQYLEAGWINLALNETRTLIRTGRDHARLLSRIVQMLDERGLYDYLPFWLEQLLRFDSRNAFALKYFARTAVTRGDLWQANTHFTAYIRFYPDDAVMQEEAGFLFHRIGKHTDSQRALERAYSLGRRSHQLITTLGHFALRGNRQDAAERFFEEARLYLPNGEHIENRLLIQSRLGAENQRLRQFAGFFENEPQRLASVLTRIAENFLELGNYRLALEEAKRVIELNDSVVPALLVIGQAELALRDYRKALQVFTQAARLDPDNALVYWHLAQYYAAEEVRNDSLHVRNLQKAVARNPREPRYPLALAGYYQSIRNHEESLKWYRRAQKLDSNETTIENIQMEERRLTEQRLLRKEQSARGNSEKLFRVALQYRDLLGKSHPGYFRCLNAASRLRPEHAGLHILSADAALSLFAAEMNYDIYLAAWRHVESALLQTPKDSTALAMKASLLWYDAKTTEDPTRLINTLTRIDLNNSPYYYEDILASLTGQNEARSARYYMTAKVLYNKNSDLAARPYLERALSLSTRNAAGIGLTLGHILREHGDHYGAIRAYERLLTTPGLANQNDYAIVSLIIGNLYADIARSAPFNLAALRHARPDLTNAAAIFSALPQITAEVTSAIQRARQAYEGYIQRTSFGTQQTRGRALITALNDISTTSAGMARRIAGMCADAGEAGLAIAILNRTLETSPANARETRFVMNDLAEILAQNGQTDEASTVWENLVRLYPDDWRSHRAYARHLLSQGELTKVIEAFERAARLSPRESDVHTVLAFLYWQQGASDRAVSALERALSLNAGNLHALYYISKIELERGNIPSAVSYGERLRDNFKKTMGQNFADEQRRNMFLDTLSTLARAAFRVGNMTRCLEYIYEGIELDREDRFAFLALAGDVRILQQKFDEAEQFYARAVQADPGNAVYRLRWAEASILSEKEEQARALLHELYRKEVHFTKRQDLLLLYADFLAKRGETRTAARVLEKLIREQAYNQTGYLALAWLQADNNQLNDAIATLERGIIFIQTAPALKDALAWLLAANRPEELLRARQLALENVTTHPGNIDYRATLGFIFLQLGQSASATRPMRLEDAERLAHARPPRPVMGSTIEAAMVYFQSDRFAEALDTIAPGEGSRELASSEMAKEKLFALLLK